MTNAGIVVGRSREVELLVAGLECGAHILLEGPPGTGKTTLLRSIAADGTVPFVFVEGNAELTPARLIGHFDPSQVLASGYTSDTFVDGPLIQAMRTGSLLYVEEINRVPEETLNVLITVMSEAELNVPRLGQVKAEVDFRLVAAMNPFDTVGTARISAAVYDRVCRITMGYQSAVHEVAVVNLRAPDVPDDWRAQIVDLVRRTRDHPDVRVGSSVRGAIDLVKLAVALSGRRHVVVTEWVLGLDAALVALSARVRLHESTHREVEEVIRQLYVEVFGAQPTPDDQEPSSGGDAPGGV